MSKTSRGFTLIELLVVIAIIAMLVSILLPSLVAAKDLAKEAVCETNHHSLITAIHLYSLQYKEFLPFANSNKMERGRTRKTAPFAEEHPGWLYHYRHSDPHKDDVTQEEGTLWPFTGDKRTYRCPGERGPYDAGPIHKLTSYEINRAVVGGSSSYWPKYRLSDFGPEAICFWETDEENSWWNDGTNNPGEGITRRHRTGATVSAFGGHTVWISLGEFYDEADRDNSRLRCVPDKDDGW